MMPIYQVPVSVNGLIPIEAANKEELLHKLHASVYASLDSIPISYEEWQVDINDEEIEEEL